MIIQNSTPFLSFLIAVFMLGTRFRNCRADFNVTSCLGSNDASPSYQSNIQSLMDSLSSISSLNTFYNTSFNGTYGLFLCRGDVNSSICQPCVQNATQYLPQQCSSNTNAVIWLDHCLVRYSNTNFFGSVTLEPSQLLWNPQNSTSPGEQDFGLLGLIYTLIDQARNSKVLFGAQEKEIGGDVSKHRYLLVQCSGDLDSDSCGSCLGEVEKIIRDCCLGKAGWRLLTPSCFIRYEEYSFFEESAVSIPVTPAAATPSQVPMSSGGELEKNGSNGAERKKVLIIVVTSLAAVIVSVLAGFLFLCNRKKGQEGEATNEDILLRNSRNSNRSHRIQAGISETNEDHSGDMHYFGLAEIQTATDDFSEANKLGEGGFGPVYKGKMLNGKEVAVKRLSMKSSQGLQEFRNEVNLIIKLQHKNLVRLLGYFLDSDEKLLVYEYMANTSLDAFLFDPKKCKLLGWEVRANVVIGTAKGMQYLHEDSRLKIIHRDLKASNILLDDEMNPKISDFGTARIFGGNQMEASTHRVVGTYGYMAPEYALEGLFSVKSDVYSFGVLMLEILSGKKNRGFYHSDSVQSLLTHAWMLWDEGKSLELVDPVIVDDCPVQEALRWVQIALLCVQNNPTLRPTMSAVVFMLGSKSVILNKPSAPPFSAASFAWLLNFSSTSGGGIGHLTSDQYSTTTST